LGKKSAISIMMQCDCHSWF